MLWSWTSHLAKISHKTNLKTIDKFYVVDEGNFLLMKVVLAYESIDEIVKCDNPMQMKATEQYFLVVLLIMLYKVVLTFEFVDEILKCDHSNESY